MSFRNSTDCKDSKSYSFFADGFNEMDLSCSGKLHRHEGVSKPVYIQPTLKPYLHFIPRGKSALYTQSSRGCGATRCSSAMAKEISQLAKDLCNPKVIISRCGTPVAKCCEVCRALLQAKLLERLVVHLAHFFDRCKSQDDSSKEKKLYWRTPLKKTSTYVIYMGLDDQFAPFF